MEIVILGFGKVGQHLLKAFHDTEDVEVVQVYHRTPISTPYNIEVTTDVLALKSAQVYIVAIPDDAIKEFSARIPARESIVVHTSGSVSINALSDNNRKGIFYPLQSFSSNRTLDFKEIPICVEAETDSDIELLKNLGESISDRVVEISSEERRILHLSAVFVNNFTNHLYSIAEDILTENNLSFDLLKPLLLETARKIEDLSPSKAQTGPAKRNDQRTIENHMYLLTNKEHKYIYKLITDAIIERHHFKK